MVKIYLFIIFYLSTINCINVFTQIKKSDQEKILILLKIAVGELEGPKVVRSIANKLIIQNFERARPVDSKIDLKKKKKKKKGRFLESAYKTFVAWHKTKTAHRVKIKLLRVNIRKES